MLDADASFCALLPTPADRPIFIFKAPYVCLLIIYLSARRNMRAGDIFTKNLDYLPPIYYNYCEVH